MNATTNLISLIAGLIALSLPCRGWPMNDLQSPERTKTSGKRQFSNEINGHSGFSPQKLLPNDRTPGARPTLNQAIQGSQEHGRQTESAHLHSLQRPTTTPSELSRSPATPPDNTNEIRIEINIDETEESAPGRISFCSKFSNYCSDFWENNSLRWNPIQFKSNLNFLLKRDRFDLTQPRRLGGLVFWGSFAAGMATLNHYYGPQIVGGFADGIGAMIAINGFETFLGLIAMPFSKPPLIAAAASTRDQIRSTAVTIPVYGRDKDLEPTIDSLMESSFIDRQREEPGILPEQFFVGENTSNYRVFYVTYDCKYVVFNSNTTEMMMLDPNKILNYDRISDNYKYKQGSTEPYLPYIKKGSVVRQEAQEAVRTVAQAKGHTLLESEIEQAAVTWMRSHPIQFGRVIMPIELAQAIVQTPPKSNRYKNVNFFYNHSGAGKVGTEYLLTFLAGQHRQRDIESGDVQPRYTFALATDDDIVVGPDFDPGLHLLSSPENAQTHGSQTQVGLIAYPIEPSNNPTNWIIERQRIQYMMADMHKNFQARIAGTILANHGAISTSLISAYKEAMRKVDGAFFGEDQKKAFSFLSDGWNIGMGPLTHNVQTTVPADIHEHWGQQVGSWATGSELLLGQWVKRLTSLCGTRCDLRTTASAPFMKLYEFQAIVTLFSSWVRPFILAQLYDEESFWIAIGVIWATDNLKNFTYENYFQPIHKNQPLPEASQMLRSFASHYMSLPFVALNMIYNSFATYVAWVGAGAGDPSNFPIMKPYDPELDSILKNDNLRSAQRDFQVGEYAKKVIFNARRVNFFDRTQFSCDE